MKLTDAKAEFIQAWAGFGADWGINRTMAQIHGLLLVSIEPLDTDRVMEELSISRGNASMNLRGLVEWGIVKRVRRPGVRREYFEAEKDLWEVARQIADRRRRKELDPVARLAERLDGVKGAPGDDPAEVRQFRRMMKDIAGISRQAARILKMVESFDRKSFFGRILRLAAR
jgi:DNA-binding transcriptional regulator GbsR (MarR family)